MKDKDPNEDELNKDEQDNINEADDSFGLPDLDFNTLEEAADAPEDSTNESEDEEVESVEDDSATEETQSDDAIDSDEDTEEEAEEDIEEEEIEEETPVSRSYVPPKPESNTPKVVAALFITIILSIGVWYFMFYRPQAAAAEKAKIEAQAKVDAAAKRAADQKRIEEQNRLAAEKSANSAADEDEKASAEATFSTISEATGRYYIVIESFVDSDMGADYGKSLASKGTSTVLLSPNGKKKFHRLTIGDYGSFLEGQEEANKLKAEFGEDLWVLKY